MKEDGLKKIRIKNPLQDYKAGHVLKHKGVLYRIIRVLTTVSVEGEKCYYLNITKKPRRF